LATNLQIWDRFRPFIRLFHRESGLHVPFAEDLLEALLVHVVDAGQARKVPGILVVVNGDGVALVKLPITAKKTAWLWHLTTRFFR